MKEGDAKMNQTRRKFLLTLNGFLVTVAAAGTLSFEGKAASDTPRWGMVIDVRKCVGCMACRASCKSENNVPLGVHRTWVEEQEKGAYPQAVQFYLPALCNHCDNPSCTKVCPVGATYQRKDGIVAVDQSACIGCGACIQACPYGARYMDPVKKVVDKCSFCVHRLEKGLSVACAENCVAKARVFGDLNDPNSEIRKIIDTNTVMTLKPETGNEPRVFYIGLESVMGGAFQ